jgi:Zn-dependent protease with chaperone function
MRILLFLGTNIAVMALLGLTFSLFGIQGLLADNGVDLNLNVLFVYFIAEILLGLFASVIVMWFSRYREFKADAGGAKLTGNINMIAALKRLHNFNKTPKLPDEMAAFTINAGKVQAIFQAIHH